MTHKSTFEHLAGFLDKGMPLARALRLLSKRGYSTGLNGRQWEDLKFPATAITPPGAASDPDWDTAKGGWLFDGASTEVLYVIAQLEHAWPEGTTLKPHVHWERTTNDGGNVRWQLRYQWAKYLTPRSDLITVSNTTPVQNVDTADTMMITQFPDIDDTTAKISDMLVMRLERTGGHAQDTYNGIDARMLEFDIHAMRDSLGSNQEYIK